jgi:hypothetical protein
MRHPEKPRGTTYELRFVSALRGNSLSWPSYNGSDFGTHHDFRFAEANSIFAQKAAKMAKSDRDQAPASLTFFSIIAIHRFCDDRFELRFALFSASTGSLLQILSETE